MDFLIRDDTILASRSCLVTQSCPTLGDPTDCSPPGSSVHGILQARILEWVAVPSSREGIFLTQGSNLRFLRLLHCRWVLYRLSHGGHIMPLMRAGFLSPSTTGIVDQITLCFQPYPICGRMFGSIPGLYP